MDCVTFGGNGNCAAASADGDDTVAFAIEAKTAAAAPEFPWWLLLLAAAGVSVAGIWYITKDKK